MYYLQIKSHSLFSKIWRSMKDYLIENVVTSEVWHVVMETDSSWLLRAWMRFLWSKKQENTDLRTPLSKSGNTVWAYKFWKFGVVIIGCIAMMAFILYVPLFHLHLQPFLLKHTQKYPHYSSYHIIALLLLVIMKRHQCQHYFKELRIEFVWNDWIFSKTLNLRLKVNALHIMKEVLKLYLLSGNYFTFYLRHILQ